MRSCDLQAVTHSRDGLAVRRVHQPFALTDQEREGCMRLADDLMALVSLERMVGRVGEPRVEGPALIDVDQLHAAANRERG